LTICVQQKNKNEAAGNPWNGRDRNIFATLAEVAAQVHDIMTVYHLTRDQQVPEIFKLAFNVRQGEDLIRTGLV
jgi:hypothetical protein